MAVFKRFVLDRSDSFTEIDSQPDNPFTILQLFEQTKVLLLTTHTDLIFTCTYNSTMNYIFKCWRNDCIISSLSSNTFDGKSKPISVIAERSNNALIIMSSGTVVLWNYVDNIVLHKILDNHSITLCHYFKDILLIGGSGLFKAYKVNDTEVTDVIKPLADIERPSFGVMLSIITLEDSIFCVCNGGIEKYRLEDEDVISRVILSDKVNIRSVITTAVLFNQYILTGHDNGDVVIWNDVLGIVRQITPHPIKNPVNCILALNDDYFVISVGMSIFVIYKYTMNDFYAQCLHAHRDVITSLLLVGMYLVSFCKGGVTRLWLMPVLRKSLRMHRKCAPLHLVGEMLSPGMSDISSTGDSDILLYGGSDGLLVWRHTRNTLMSHFSKIREMNTAVESDDSSTESCDSIDPYRS